jgi:hypothetical protein
LKSFQVWTSKDGAEEIREMELNVKWKKFMLEIKFEKQQIITQLMEAFLLRNTNSGNNKRGKN